MYFAGTQGDQKQEEKEEPAFLKSSEIMGYYAVVSSGDPQSKESRKG
jgi:hypothetical protein